MKRLTLSVLLIVTFAAYAVYIKLGGANYNTAPILVNKQSSTTSGVPNSQTSSLPKNSAQNYVSAPASVTAPAPVVSPQNNGQYRDGSYVGNVEDAFYGNVQVKVIISGGQINDVQFLDYPHDRNTSVRINTQAMPYLKQEAIQAQSANVDIVSGATATSEAFIQSLSSALSQAS